MERGVKLAVVVAAVVCLVAGLAWDRVVRTVVSDADGEVVANASDATADLPTDPGCRMEFTFVGSLSEAPEPPVAVDRSATRQAGPAASNSRSNGTGSAGTSEVADSQLVSSAAVSPSTNSASGSGGDPAAASRERLYTVRTGDRLGSISKKFFGTEKYWRDIMTYNNIRDPRALRPNQVLKIPPINAER